MTTPPTPPHRRHKAVLTIEADTIDALVGSLTSIATQLDIDDMGHRDWTQPVDITSGGPTSGYRITMTTDPEMDHDRYFAEIKTWLEADRACRKAPKA